MRLTLRKPLEWIFPQKRPLRWALPLALLAASLVLQMRLPGWADRVEAWTLDARFMLRGTESPHYPIQIIALDEDSFQMMGDLWGENIRTWPRARWAELVRKIAEGKPRLIVLDVVFDTPGWDAGGDQALAQELAEAGNSLLAAHFGQSAAEEYSRTTYSPPIALLSQSAVAVGVANLEQDVDGFIRREPVLWSWGGKSLPSLALASATLYRGKPVDVNSADLGPDLSLGINFRGPEGTFPTFSMYQVWSGEIPASRFQDAIVLVGYTTQLEQDRHLAPFASERQMPGVEIQANGIDTLLAGDWLRRPPDWLPMALAVGAVLVGLGLASLPWHGWGALVFGGVMACYLGLGWVLFLRQQFVLPLAAPLILAILSGGLATTERLIFAERDKRLLRRRFAGMMSPERLQAVLDNWETLLDVERPEKEAAVLFADIRGFTHATETLMRQNRSPEMVRFLNVYLDAMAQAVFAEGGVVYRTFGDGLLILFGVPEPLPEHSVKAVRAAVRMALATQELQAVWPLREECPFEMGVGMNDGFMIDAIVGRGRRFDYTVLGDPVNAAARIEAHCKVAMEIPRPPGGQAPETVTILLSDALYQKVKEQVIVDENVPPFEARGISEPLKVVRLLGLVEGEML